MTGNLYLLRHGQTEWAMSGQYTGLTDIPLTETGREQAKNAGERLRSMHPDEFIEIITSPSQRAIMTAELAGYAGHVDSRAHEWDYGRAEGNTRQTISRLIGHEWDIWKDGTNLIPVCDETSERIETINNQSIHIQPTDGETLNDAYERANTLIESIKPALDKGDVLIVAHSHIIRILATAWLHVNPLIAQHLELGTAEIAVLGEHKGTPVIKKWGC